MSERKVLNKYYPPDFDPAKIPRMKLAKNRQYTVRLMAPFNMRCVTCGEYIYKGKKFNARKEDVEGQDYLGIRIYRFYIKCTRCLQEISFKTDPQNTDYEIEAGATRNFMARKLAEEKAQKDEDERIEDESTNPMKLLENRTKQSKQEIELLESLEELRDLNRRQQSVDYDQMLNRFDTKETARLELVRQEEEDEQYIRSVFRAGGSGSKSKVLEEEVVDEEVAETVVKLEPEDDEPRRKMAKTTETFHDNSTSTSTTSAPTLLTTPAPSVIKLPHRGIEIVNKKSALVGLVRLKPQAAAGALKTSNAPPASVAETIVKDVGVVVNKTAPVANGLALLGLYSGTDSDSN